MNENRRGFLKWVGAVTGLGAAKAMGATLNDGTDYYEPPVKTQIKDVVDYQIPSNIACSGSFFWPTSNTGPR